MGGWHRQHNHGVLQYQRQRRAGEGARGRAVSAAAWAPGAFVQEAVAGTSLPDLDNRCPNAPPRAQTADIMVPWGTRAITATAGSDFVAASGTVTFTPSSYGPQTVSVVVNGDNAFEGNETFAVDITPWQR